LYASAKIAGKVTHARAENVLSTSTNLVTNQNGSDTFGSHCHEC
jgi:hypothetical protein